MDDEDDDFTKSPAVHPVAQVVLMANLQPLLLTGLEYWYYDQDWIYFDVSDGSTIQFPYAGVVFIKWIPTSAFTAKTEEKTHVH